MAKKSNRKEFEKNKMVKKYKKSAALKKIINNKKLELSQDWSSIKIK